MRIASQGIQKQDRYLPDNLLLEILTIVFLIKTYAQGNEDEDEISDRSKPQEKMAFAAENPD